MKHRARYLAPVAILLATTGCVPQMFGTATDGAACSTTTTGALSVDTSALPSMKGYSKESLALVAQIMKAGEKSGVGERGQLIGIMTAMQESTLQNLTGGDRDSVGAFQQRPSQGWGTAEQLADPSYAATAFFEGVDAANGSHIPGLKDVDGWQDMSLTDAAQAVQRSGYPGAYAKHENTARTLMAKVSGVPVEDASGSLVQSSLGCDSSGGEANGPIGANATGTVKGVLKYAMQWRGKGLTYHLGGGTLEGPTNNTLDCSSFVGSAWKQGAGVEFGRSAQDQWNNLAAYRVDPSDIQPGDLIFEAWGRRGTVGGTNAVSHVAMYVGGGQMVEWSRSKNGFALGTARLDGSQFVGIARPPADDAKKDA
ncbi:C40 family peptidase [Brachybacterium halotolerans subsp. kimchii]|uniref:C40 family peptidase n=1 Tax=Brachybacterium halotolerans TaxID=2795215 RepID=UPI001E61734F|nr:C40 family peptidase [Brachybacterium halotolerans]UEJ82806.1 C40 family peptidase [Brachybacterium halotolerans subsp. kimchii]